MMLLCLTLKMSGKGLSGNSCISRQPLFNAANIRDHPVLSVLLTLSLVLASVPGETLAAGSGGAAATQVPEDNVAGQTQTETDGMPEDPAGSGEGAKDDTDVLQYTVKLFVWEGLCTFFYCVAIYTRVQ